MLRQIELLHWSPQSGESDRQRTLATMQKQDDGLLQPTLPGSYNGGDLLRRRCVDAPKLASAADGFAHVDAAVYEEIESGGDWLGGGVYRALLLSVHPGTSAAMVARFERETLAMPRYIQAIRGWRLGRVQQAQGSQAWTHVWEQRYERVEGLLGPYMLHPYHWAHVDRWFDPESQDWIVDPQLCHSFCRIEGDALI